MGWRRPDTKQSQVINSLGNLQRLHKRKWYYNKIKQDVKTMVDLHKDTKDYHLLTILFDLINQHDDYITDDVKNVVLKILIQEYGKIGDFDPKKSDYYAEDDWVPKRDENEYGVSLYFHYLRDKMNLQPTDKEIDKQLKIVRHMTNDELKKLLRKYNNDWHTYWTQKGRKEYEFNEFLKF